MNNNEEKLNKLVDTLNFELKEVKSSDAYKVGTALCKNKVFRFLLNIIKSIKGKHLKEDLLNYSYKTEDYSYSNTQNKKIVVYKCVTGNYDRIVAPKYKSDKVDYVLFTNNKNIKSKEWKIVYIDNIKGLNDAMLNRYVRMHPHEYLKEYDYAIYVDGNMTIYSDLSCFINRINTVYGLSLSMHSTRNKLTSEYKACKKLKKGNSDKMLKQINSYLSQGMPDDYGLLETTVIAIDLKNKKSAEILDQWWNEFLLSGSMRDQVSLPYILWKNNIQVKDLGTLGNNIWLNPKFTKERHLK